MNESFCTSIDKLTYWRGGTWVRYEATSYDLNLRIHCDQLLITNHDKLLESLNMNGNIKGIYKKDVLILILSTGTQAIRKIKFQMKINASLCLQNLGNHFLVLSHSSSSKNYVQQYRNIDNVFNNVMEKCDSKKSDSTLSSIPLPTNFSNFVKLCLMDPAFPNFVRETEKIIKTDTKKN